MEAATEAGRGDDFRGVGDRRAGICRGGPPPYGYVSPVWVWISTRWLERVLPTLGHPAVAIEIKESDLALAPYGWCFAVVLALTTLAYRRGMEELIAKLTRYAIDDLVVVQQC